MSHPPVACSAGKSRPYAAFEVAPDSRGVPATRAKAPFYGYWLFQRAVAGGNVSILSHVPEATHPDVNVKVRLGANRVRMVVLGMQNRTFGPCSTTSSRIRLVVFGMQNRTFGPCSTTSSRIRLVVFGMQSRTLVGPCSTATHGNLVLVLSSWQSS
jgi:hypothetical protein